MRASKYFGEQYSNHPPTLMTQLLGERHGQQPHVMAVAGLKAVAMRRLEDIGYSVPLHRLRACQGAHVDALHRAGLTRDGMVLAISNNSIPGTPIVRALSVDAVAVVGWFDKEDHGERRYVVRPAFEHQWTDMAGPEGCDARLCPGCGLMSLRQDGRERWTYPLGIIPWALPHEPICLRTETAMPLIPNGRTRS